MSMLQSPLQSEEQMAGLTEDYANHFAPATNEVEGEDASPDEEAAMGIGLHKMMEDLYSDETMPKFANVFHQDRRPLMEVIPDILQPMLLAAKNEIEEATDEEAPSSVFFSEDGLMHQGVNMLFDMAQALAIPGSDDPDQFAAALMNIYKKAGEYILEKGDEDARREALELGGEMVARAEGTEDLDEAAVILQKRMKKGGLPQEVHDSLLGGEV